jgi:hypothetical protein
MSTLRPYHGGYASRAAINVSTSAQAIEPKEHFMRSIRILLLVSIVSLAALSVSVASAAPANAPSSTSFDLACDNGETYTIVLNGNGPFTPGHVIDGNGRTLIPVAFAVEGVDEDGNLIFSDSGSKKGRMNGLTGRMTDCTFSDIVETPDFVVTISGTATVYEVPGH